MRLGQPTTQGSLDKAIIRRYIKRNLAKITYCYEKELLAKPGLEGTVETRFVIGSDGSMSTATVTGLDAIVATCITGVIMAIQFPEPTDGGGVTVSYPFTFAPASP